METGAGLQWRLVLDYNGDQIETGANVNWDTETLHTEAFANWSLGARSFCKWKPAAKRLIDKPEYRNPTAKLVIGSMYGTDNLMR